MTRASLLLDGEDEIEACGQQFELIRLDDMQKGKGVRKAQAQIEDAMAENFREQLCDGRGIDGEHLAFLFPDDGPPVDEKAEATSNCPASSYRTVRNLG